jgi:hypothetical protein
VKSIWEHFKQIVCLLTWRAFNKLSIDCRCYLLIGSTAINPQWIAQEWLSARALHALIELTREYTKAQRKDWLLWLAIYIYPMTNVSCKSIESCGLQMQLWESERERYISDWGCWSRMVLVRFVGAAKFTTNYCAVWKTLLFALQLLYCKWCWMNSTAAGFITSHSEKKEQTERSICICDAEYISVRLYFHRSNVTRFVKYIELRLNWKKACQ